MLYACAALAMAPPDPITDDSVSLEDGRDKFSDSTVTAVGKDSAMAAAEGLDRRVSVVDRVIAVARPASRNLDDAQVVPTDQYLSVARPAVVF